MILIVYLNVRLQQYIIYLNLQSSGGFFASVCSFYTRYYLARNVVHLE